MRRLLYYVLPICVGLGSFYTSYAQSVPVKFGKVEMPDLQMKTYEKDTSAEAVVLCDYGTARMQYNQDKGFQLNFERTVRIKILKKSGYDWATGQIVTYKSPSGEGRKLVELKGNTYNLENGKIVKEKMSKESIFTEKVVGKYSTQKFTLPNVREGSVIEYTYTILSDNLYSLEDWQFQETIPTVWSEYRMIIPTYFNYKIQTHGYEPFHVSNLEYAQESFIIQAGAPPLDARSNSYRWVMKDVPAIRSEAYITTVNDYLSSVEFELSSVNIPGQRYQPVSSTWTAIAQELFDSESFGMQMKRGGFMKDVAAKIKTEHKEPAAQAIAAYEYIRHHMSWNGEIRMYSDGTKKAYESHTGSSADINLMLIALLQDLGLNARPVLISTRDHGRVLPYYVSQSKFNYVLAHVQLGEEYLLLDACDDHVTPGVLPIRCLNGIGRIMDEKGGDWVSLAPKEKKVELITVDMTIQTNGDIKGKIEKSLAGYTAASVRRKIEEEGSDKYTETLRKAYTNWQIDKLEMQNVDKPSQALNEKFELTIAEAAQQAGNRLYLKPLLTEAITENPFKLTERKYPVDFATNVDHTYIANFTIPEGYTVEEMPKNINLVLPENAAKFSFVVGVNGNKIQVMHKFLIRKPVFYAEEYLQLRELYTQMVSKHAEQIVLKKI